MTTSPAINYTPRAYTAEETQDNFLSHMAQMVPYWVNSTHYAYIDAPLKDKLSGLMHTFYVDLTGGNSSARMMAYTTTGMVKCSIAEGRNYFPVGFENAVDINDGTLQYHSAENLTEVTVQNDEEPREWTAEEIRNMYFDCISRILNHWDSRSGTPDLEKGAGMLRDIFVLFEGGNRDFPARIDLVSDPHPENKEFRIGRGENYHESGTRFYTPDRNLVKAWDFWWDKVSSTL